MFGSISSAIYLTDDGYLLLSSWVMTKQILSETAPLAALEIGHHSALSEYSVNRDALPWFLMGVHFEQNKTFLRVLNLPGFILFMACQYRDDGHQESHFIGLSGFVGKI